MLPYFEYIKEFVFADYDRGGHMLGSGHPVTDTPRQIHLICPEDWDYIKDVGGI